MIRLFLLILFVILGIILVGSYSSGKFIIPQATSWNLPSSNIHLAMSKASPVASVQSLTLERIFKDTDSPTGDNLITVIATGDIIPARSTNFQTTQRKDFTWPFQKTADILKSADLTFINLETPLMKDCQLMNEGMRFCGSDKHIEGLTYAGVDVASLANNHSANYGKQGIDETKNLLESNGILVTGLNGPVYKEVKGVKFAFLGYSDIEKTSLVSVADENKITAEVSEAKKKADVVIVQYHWGTEYITPPEDRQKFLGKLTIDAGADLVIGNHPHWIKPVEFYKGKLITYGHGNFVFDQEWSQKTKEGIIGVYTFDGKNLVDVKYLPVEIINYGQPYFLEGAAKQKILDEVYNESLKLK